MTGLHGDYEWDALESWNEVEGALFWYGFEALRGGGTDDEGPAGLFDLNGLWIWLVYCFAGSGDDRKEELQR